MLQVEQLQKNFGSTRVLADVSFTLEQGQVLSILGSSGSGKTTLLRCLNFLETADQGRILLNGKTLWQTGQKTVEASQRLHMGLVFQGFHLFPQYTALQNVMLAPQLQAKRNKKLTRQEQQRLEEKSRLLLTQVGLQDRLNHYPCQLSGGQQQRVAIARALAMEPDILCFDEPTSALDPELTREVLRVLRQLKAQNTTMIVVTHELEFARQVSDRVLFMADGVILEQGTPQEIFENPKTEKLRAFLAQSPETP